MKTNLKRLVVKSGSMKTPDVVPISLVHDGGVIMKKGSASLLLLVASLMNPRRQREFCCVVLAAALSLGASGIATAQQCLVSTIAFAINRDHPYPDPPIFRPNPNDFEIYLMNPDGTNV